LYRTAILFLVGIVIALAASSLLARRLVQPILTLKNGASRIGRGELATRIHIETGDEIEILANEFNMMAGKLQESYAGLEQKVAEKTSQLTLANRHKSEFLANMSHELRTPLNAIIGFSDVLREQYFGPLNQKQLEYVRDINASGQHLLSLINDILDLSKIEAGRMDLDLSTFSLPGTIEQALVLVRERAANKGLRLKSTIGDDVGLITADERKVKQILINLLSNAVKFSDAGGWVEVNVSRSSNGSVISVKDNGIGIAAEDQTAVFEEFKQLKTSGSAKQEGTGLGLPMSRKLTELHGGRIWVESEVGHGATFTFTLPDIPASLPQSK
jgi:signal transduction histidine kinase